MNQFIKRKYKDSTVHQTEYQSKRNPTGKPRWTWQQLKHQAPTISSIAKSISRNRHRVWSPARRRAIKEESEISKWVWSRNTTITNSRQTHGAGRKSHTTITRHQEDKLSKAISSLFPVNIANLNGRKETYNKTITDSHNGSNNQ